MLAQNRFELASMPEGELRSHGPDGRRGVHTTEQPLHAATAHQVEVIDAVHSGARQQMLIIPAQDGTSLLPTPHENPVHQRIAAKQTGMAALGGCA